MKGGGVAKLPLNPTTTTRDALKAEWDFKYVSGHGVSNTKIFVVPENTYIYFSTKAGEGAVIEELPEIHNFIYNLLGSDKLDTWWDNILKQLQRGTLFKDIVYDPEQVPGPVNEASVKRAFYAPGDIIQDLTLSFKNYNVRPIFPIGLYQIPIPGSLKDRLDTFNADKSEVVDAETDKRFFNIDINLLKRKLFDEKKLTSTLFETINTLGPLGRKKRLLVVDTCRSPSTPVPNETMGEENKIRIGRNRNNERRLCRSLSVCGRQYTCPLPPTVHTVNIKALRDVKKVLAVPSVGSPNEALKKAIEKLLASLYDEDGERTVADRSLLADVLAKAETAVRPIRGGKSRRRHKKNRTRRRRA
jgi:hypothetical protein